MRRRLEIKTRISTLWFWVLGMGIGWVQSVMAVPPGFPTAESKGASLAAAGQWLEVIKRYIGQGGMLVGLALSVLAFVWVGYAALAKFNEARTGRAEWAEMGVLAAAGAVILIFIAILLSQVGTAVGTLATAG